jgi:hypothetical protein
MGQRFFEATLPNLVLEIRRVANALEDVADTLRGATERRNDPTTEKETTDR